MHTTRRDVAGDADRSVFPKGSGRRGAARGKQCGRGRAALVARVVGSALIGPGAVTASAAATPTVEVANLGFAVQSGPTWTLAGDRLALFVSEFGGSDLNGDGDASDEVLHVYDVVSGTTANLRIAGIAPLALEGGHIAFVAGEQPQGADLNGDGDSVDQVVHVYDPVTGVMSNLGLAGGRMIPLDGGALAFTAFEASQGADLNGDGDIGFLELVFHVHDPATGTTTNLGLAGPKASPLPDGKIAFRVFESRQGVDLNGDGDTDDGVVHLHDPATGTTTNIGLAGSARPVAVGGGAVAFFVSEPAQAARDLNGDGDVNDLVLHLYDEPSGLITNLGIAGFGSRWRNGEVVPLGGAAFAFLVAGAEAGVDSAVEGVVHVHDVATGVTRNLGLAVENDEETPTFRVFDDGRLAFRAVERLQGSDLNGDGDLADGVGHVYDPATGTTVSTGLGGDIPRPRTGLDGDTFAFLAGEGEEGGEGADLNGDGDTDDLVVHQMDPSTGEIVNFGITAQSLFRLADGTLAATTREAQENADLNGDGDIADIVVAVLNPDTAATANLGIASIAGVNLPGGEFLMFAIEGMEGADLSGDGDTSDLVAHVVSIDWGTEALQCDANGDGSVDRVDIASIFAARGQPAGGPDDPRDVNGDGLITVNDGRICVLQCTNPRCAPSAVD